jgi:pimeloyl-ACP methyl ester carboxylesterase
MKKVLFASISLVLFTGCLNQQKQKLRTELVPVTKSQRQEYKTALETGKGSLPLATVGSSPSPASSVVSAPSSSPSPSLAVSPLPSAASEACDSFIAKLGGNFHSDSIEVPENWDHPESSKSIRVFYYWRDAIAAIPGASSVPVVFFNGGPADDSHGSAELIEQNGSFTFVPFVYIDQRGTGCSDPFPVGNDEVTAARTAKYGSRGIVRDAEAIRKKVFGANVRWRAYGQSYGGLITQRYLEIAPEGLDRAISHGFSIMSDPAQWTADRVHSQELVAQQFFAKYPGDKDLLKNARAKIAEDQCWSAGDNKVCGPVVLDALVMLLGFNDRWDEMDGFIQALATTDGDIYQEALNEFVRSFTLGMYADTDLAEPVLTKLEITPGLNDPDGCAAAMEKLKAQGEDPDHYDFNECRLYLQMQIPAEAMTAKIQADPIDLDKVLKNIEGADAPDFYLFSGQKDVFVPYTTFDEEVKKLGDHVKYESFPNSGHEGFLSESDVVSAVIQKK